MYRVHIKDGTRQMIHIIIMVIRVFFLPDCSDTCIGRQMAVYLSIVKAIMVMMDTWVTNSEVRVMNPHPRLPNGHGYCCQIRNISMGITAD